MAHKRGTKIIVVVNVENFKLYFGWLRQKNTNTTFSFLRMCNQNLKSLTSFTDQPCLDQVVVSNKIILKTSFKCSSLAIKSSKAYSIIVFNASFLMEFHCLFFHCHEKNLLGLKNFPSTYEQLQLQETKTKVLVPSLTCQVVTFF